jgi:hypothetical protein
MSLHSTRTSNGFGANPITFSEMKSYFDLIQVEPEEWEIDLIRRFDSAAIDSYEEAAKKSAPKQ